MRYAAACNDYATAIVDGIIPACKWVKLACKRHLDLLEKSKDETSKYFFDEAAVEKICQFAELLPHVKGEWAKRREKIKLMPWQCFLLGNLFGWKVRKTGLRKFRECYLEVPRKSSKSTLGAIIGNYMLTMDGEEGAEVYSGATSERQAYEVFSPAKYMMQKSPELTEATGADILAKSIIVPRSHSKFEVLIGNPGDGSSPTCVIIDEYHEHITSSQYDTMVTGTGARQQPLIIIITTAGFSLSGPCHDKHTEAKRVLEGVIESEQLFTIIYTIDEKDDWLSPESLIKANPNYGVSVSDEFLLTQQRQAAINTQYQNRFKTKHLNVWCSANAAWMNLQQWQMLGDKELTEDELTGCDCVFAVDLASKSDLCAFVKLFAKPVGAVMHYYVFCKCYLPEDEARNAGANSAAYQKWSRQGLLTLTDGATVDYETIFDDVVADAKKYNPREFVYDPFNATHFSQLLMNEGLTCVEFNQKPVNFAVPMDEVVTLVKDGRIHHNANEMLTWMIANTAVRPAKKGMFSPIKEKPEQKIDGSVALMMAKSRMAEYDPNAGFAQFINNPVTV